MLARSLQPAPPPGEPRRIGNVEIRPDELQVLVNGQRAGLTVREFEILCVLAERLDRVVPAPRSMSWGGAERCPTATAQWTSS